MNIQTSWIAGLWYGLSSDLCDRVIRAGAGAGYSDTGAGAGVVDSCMLRSHASRPRFKLCNKHKRIFVMYLYVSKIATFGTPTLLVLTKSYVLI